MRSVHVCPDKSVRRHDRPVHVTLGREMHDRVEIMLVEQILGQVPIANVAVHEQECLVVLERVEIGAVAGIGQGIENDDAICRSQTAPMQDEIGADKSCAAGYQKCRHGYWFWCAARSNEIVLPISRCSCPVNTKPCSRKRCADTS